MAPITVFPFNGGKVGGETVREMRSADSDPQTRLPPARNASQREAGGLRGTSGQVDAD